MSDETGKDDVEDAEMTATDSSGPSAGTRTPDPEHQLPPGGDVPDQLRKAGLGALIRDLANDTQTLVQQEIRLAQVEATRAVKRVVVDSAWIGAGVAVVAVGGLCLVLALALGLGALLDSYWLGTLITGGTLFLVGALLAWKGVRDLRSGGFAPTAITRSLREDREWAEREVDDFKQALGRDGS